LPNGLIKGRPPAPQEVLVPGGPEGRRKFRATFGGPRKGPHGTGGKGGAQVVYRFYTGGPPPELSGKGGPKRRLRAVGKGSTSLSCFF